MGIPMVELYFFFAYSGMWQWSEGSLVEFVYYVYYCNEYLEHKPQQMLWT